MTIAAKNQMVTTKDAAPAHNCNRDWFPEQRCDRAPPHSSLCVTWWIGPWGQLVTALRVVIS